MIREMITRVIFMLTTMMRTLILYVLLIIIMRIMGKRQIGQLQPGELVITILISEIAAIPMQDNDIPMINSVIAVLLLAAFEIIISAVSMKSIRFRSILQGNSIVIIKNGKLDQKQLRRLRYTVDDLLEALRQKDVFNISDVQYAVAETDGTLSVLLKPEKRGVTMSAAKLKAENSGLQCIVISDGKIIETELKNCGMTTEKLKMLLDQKGLDPKKILLMSSDINGNVNIIEKEQDK